MWSVPKLAYDLLRRNASTNGRKTDLIERYILHRKPKHTIYCSLLVNIIVFADRRPPSWNRITDSTHAPPVGNGIGEPHFVRTFLKYGVLHLPIWYTES
jgi:hypothetical protein